MATPQETLTACLNSRALTSSNTDAILPNERVLFMRIVLATGCSEPGSRPQNGLDVVATWKTRRGTNIYESEQMAWLDGILAGCHNILDPAFSGERLPD